MDFSFSLSLVDESSSMLSINLTFYESFALEFVFALYSGFYISFICDLSFDSIVLVDFGRMGFDRLFLRLVEC